MESVYGSPFKFFTGEEKSFDWMQARMKYTALILNQDIGDKEAENYVSYVGRRMTKMNNETGRVSCMPSL